VACSSGDPSSAGEAGEFLEVADAFLAAREAEHNVLLELAGRLVAEPSLDGCEPTARR